MDFQDLVKYHNLRFNTNPIVVGDSAMVSISGEHLPPGGCNAFFSDWERFTTPIREISTPSWKHFFRHFGIKFN